MRFLGGWLGILFLCVSSYGVMAGDGIVPFVTADTFLEDVLKSKEPVLIQFEAAWCPYCRKMQPTLNTFYEENKNVIKVRRVDIDQEPELATSFGIRQLPTMVLLKDGAEIDFQARVMSVRDLEKWMDERL